MSYVFFQSVLEALGKKLNFESLSNMYGKTVFDKKGGDAINQIIAAANPLVKNGGKKDMGVQSLMGNIKVIDSKSKEAAIKSAEEKLGDLSWASGLF